jgi:superfamily II DNA or RNA helicase
MNLVEYESFVNSKSKASKDSGFEPNLSRYPLFDYQVPITKWCCRRGRAALFADTGLGKTIMQLAWADQVAKHTNIPVLVVAPLAVSEQTIDQGAQFGIEVERYQGDEVSGPKIIITNYEQLHKIHESMFSGVVLDESSILKNSDGKTRRMITSMFSQTPYRLSCSATPSPNDFMELGTQAEFLGIMSQVEMLAMFFIHDGSDTSKWRLKGHGKKKFFEWLATWAIFITKPSDIGFDDTAHDLPELVFHEHIIDSGITDGLFAPIATGLLERNRARKDTVQARVEEAATIANGIKGKCLVWCHLNDESERLKSEIDGGVEVKGSDSPEHKTKSMVGFAKGDVNKLISKPSICGFGMNFQACNHMIFVGLSDSWEQFYQAVRRCWRYGQKKPVHVHIISADVEGAVLTNIKRKEAQHKQLMKEMLAIMRDKTLAELGCATQEKTEYKPENKMELPIWVA